MGLYSTWMDIASAQRSQEEQKTFWETYFAAEKEGYKQILDTPEKPFVGKLSDIAKKFDMESVVFIGFVDGINTSLKAGEYDLEKIEEDSNISLEVDLEKLYYNMLDAKADWLYKLPQWGTLLSEEKKSEISKQFRKDNIYVAEKAIGRNDPCSCGSGKKYKKCCGAPKSTN